MGIRLTMTVLIPASTRREANKSSTVFRKYIRTLPTARVFPSRKPTARDSCRKPTHSAINTDAIRKRRLPAKTDESCWRTAYLPRRPSPEKTDVKNRRQREAACAEKNRFSYLFPLKPPKEPLGRPPHGCHHAETDCRCFTCIYGSVRHVGPHHQ